MIVDIHGHITSPKLFQRFPMPPALADIEGMIQQKLDVGIELTIVGSPVGEGTMMKVPGLDNYAQPADQLKSFHEWLASECQKHAPHLKGYVYTNPFDESLLDQTAKTARQDEFVGLIINTSIQGEYLDSKKADAFFAMAVELDVPVFLHPPAEPVGAAAFADYRLVEQVARFNDVTSSLAVLVFSGRLENFPQLKLIGATGGGCLALLPSRLDLAYKPRHWGKKPAGGPPSSGPPGGGPPSGRPPTGGSPAGGPPRGGPPAGMIQQFEDRISRDPSVYIKQLYVDTAIMSGAALQANLETLGADHLLFGTDSPPLATPLEEVISRIKNLPMPEDQKQQILSGNARRLFRL
jgi:aminocarboxymuconate-semialdehyde decarboxylase